LLQLLYSYHGNNANGSYSTVYGTGNTASGQYATSFGNSNNATGDYSTVYGSNNTASGQSSICFGDGNTSAGYYSTALGENNTATGDFSCATGLSTTAKSFDAFVTGQYNIDNGTSNQWISADPLFIIGNGLSSTARNNAVTVLKNGNVGIGLANPAYALDVAGTGNFTGFKLGTTSTDGYVLTSDNTGLGTWQPLFSGQLSMQNGMMTFSNDLRVTGKLHVGNSSLILDGAAGNPLGNEIYNDGTQTVKDLIVQSNASNLAGNTILNANGNTGSVGIGTTTPSSLYKLDVNGTVNMTGFKLSGAGLTNGMVLTTDGTGKGTWTALPGQPSQFWGGSLSGSIHSLNSGNVGIGTSTPGSNLEVDGLTNPWISVNYKTATSHAGIFMGVSTCPTCFSNQSVTNDVVFSSVGAQAENVILQSNTKGKSLKFVTSRASDGYGSVNMEITSEGNVGIGTNCAATLSKYKLAVNGAIVCKEIDVELPDASGCFPDYVFDSDYKLISLNDLEKFITANKHLPEVPSAKEVERDGMKLGEMNVLLLKKIEELTLYTISLEKRIKEIEVKK
jgi:hypothetical protein